MERKNLNISGELHLFLKKRALEPDAIEKKLGIADLAEQAIRCHFGVDENGRPLLDPKKTPKNRVKEVS